MCPSDEQRSATAGRPILLIDGECVLCNRVAQFVIRHDPAGIFRFAALQSPVSARLLRERGLPPPPSGTFVLVTDTAVSYRSDAALRVLGMLPLPWRIARFALAVPRPLRDLGYRVIARTRIAIFGSTTRCGLLSPAERERFFDEEDSKS